MLRTRRNRDVVVEVCVVVPVASDAISRELFGKEPSEAGVDSTAGA